MGRETSLPQCACLLVIFFIVSPPLVECRRFLDDDYPSLFHLLSPRNMLIKYDRYDPRARLDIAAPPQQQPLFDLPTGSATSSLWRRLAFLDKERNTPAIVQQNQLARAIRCPPLTCSGEDMRPA